jgi:hypothetical protein
MLQKRKAKPRKPAYKNEEAQVTLERYENDCKKITSTISVKNILELKDYYFHQQETQSMLMQEIREYEKEKEDKKLKLVQIKQHLVNLQHMKDGKIKLAETKSCFNLVSLCFNRQ